MTGLADPFLAEARAIIGRRGVVHENRRMQRFLSGYRVGSGPAVAVLRPSTLVQLWRLLQLCLRHDKIIIMQASNTGLTGGSTPFGEYDRDVVIISMTNITNLHVLRNGAEVLCLPGTTLNQLEAALDPLGREPHSVIGSSCIGASVIGGICNNSGGALLRRGPAYTERALFARLDANGELRLVNHLGINLAGPPENQLAALDEGSFSSDAVSDDPCRRTAWSDYDLKVRGIDENTPARYNANPEGLFEASGSAGRIAVFAVRVATFPKDKKTQVFYVGTNEPEEFTSLRRHMLSQFRSLPVSAEYLHRDCFDVAAKYGKDSFLAIRLLGTKRLRTLFVLKHGLDQLGSRLGIPSLSDQLLQSLAALLPQHLPRRMRDFRERFEHHLILQASGDGIAETRAYLQSRFPSQSGDIFECNANEARSATLHRFVAAGAAIRYSALHADKTEGIISLDFALRRNDRGWSEALPEAILRQVVTTLRYGHFFCHVFHHDYIVKKGCDTEAVKMKLLGSLEQRRAAYPAEHNVGHIYSATPELSGFYQSLDPTNTFNPGLGRTSRMRNWA